MKFSMPIKLVSAAAAVAAVLTSPGAVRAQDYPSKDIQVICAFPAGSGADILVRYFAEKLKPYAKRPVITLNKPGAGGNIAAEFTVRSEPDGHTIYVHAANTAAAAMSLYKKPPFDAVKDLQVVATLNKQAFMIVVAATSPYKTLGELTAAMKTKGAKASYAQSNISGRVIGELYRKATGIEAVEVPFKQSAEIINELLSGAIDFAPMDGITALAQQREGRLRVLAAATPERLKAAPEVPTMAELGVPGVEMLIWFAAMVPANTPKPVIDQLSKWFSEIVATEETRVFLARTAGDPFISTPEEGQKLMAKQVQDWAGYVKAAKIEPQ